MVSGFGKHVRVPGDKSTAVLTSASAVSLIVEGLAYDGGRSFDLSQGT